MPQGRLNGLKRESEVAQMSKKLRGWMKTNRGNEKGEIGRKRKVGSDRG